MKRAGFFDSMSYLYGSKALIPHRFKIKGGGFSTSLTNEPTDKQRIILFPIWSEAKRVKRKLLRSYKGYKANHKNKVC